MTIKELYLLCKENEAEDYEVKIQYRDGGGLYCGKDSLDKKDVVINKNETTITL